MSLIDEYVESCTIINKITSNSSYGGVVTTWEDGATIEAAIEMDNSLEAKIAETQGVTGVYTIITPRSINLQYHEVIRRNRDGKIFRVTSRGDDKKTPQSSSLDMRAVSAEEWSLPTDG